MLCRIKSRCFNAIILMRFHCYYITVPLNVLRSFVTILTCSSRSSIGHGGRLSGRTSRRRTRTARCLTYAQHWTSWGTIVASCPACTPCQAMTPSPTLYGKGKKSALEVLMNNDIDGVQDTLGELDISQGQPKATAGAFRFPEYRYGINIHERREATAAKEATTDRHQPATTRAASLSPIDVLEAADQRHPQIDARDIRRFGWEFKEGGVVTPSVSNAPVAPHGLLEVVSCICSAERKACSEKRCSCHSAGLSCTEYCYCEGEIRAAVPSISTQRRINWLTIYRKTSERLTMLNR